MYQDKRGQRVEENNSRTRPDRNPQASISSHVHCSGAERACVHRPFVSARCAECELLFDLKAVETLGATCISPEKHDPTKASMTATVLQSPLINSIEWCVTLRCCLAKSSTGLQLLSREAVSSITTRTKSKKNYAKMACASKLRFPEELGFDRDILGKPRLVAAELQPD